MHCLGKSLEENKPATLILVYSDDKIMDTFIHPISIFLLIL